MIKKVGIALFAIVLPTLASAGINEDMQSFMKKFNSSSNVTGADIYKSQKAGYMTGGGLSIRNEIVSRRPVSVTLPSVDAGCGGIDLYTGAFSYISGDEIVKTLKSIASSAQGYAFLLALETVSPQIANNIKNLQAMANEINGQNINSCEMATQLVGMAWPQESVAKERICQTAETQRGRGADWVTTRHQCTNRHKKEQNQDIGKDDALKLELLGEEFNIAWEALKKQSFAVNNQERAEYFMSLLGTVTRRINKGEIETAHHPSKVFDETFLSALVNGGDTTIYKCSDKERCLLLKEVKYTIPKEKSWVGYVRSILFDIEKKIIADQELDKEEIKFLAKTRFPLYRIINVISAYSKGNNPADM
ncbi:MAG: conjugal transfer protein TraH, partial [Waddliaceae bacterium]